MAVRSIVPTGPSLSSAKKNLGLILKNIGYVFSDLGPGEVWAVGVVLTLLVIVVVALMGFPISVGV